jgi:hypothetical protein
MRHRRELEITQHHLPAFAVERYRGGDRGDGDGCARYDRDLVGIGANGVRCRHMQALDLRHPLVPGRSPVCHDSIYILSAPSTGIDSAPCEQLFT